MVLLAGIRRSARILPLMAGVADKRALAPPKAAVVVVNSPPEPSPLAAVLVAATAEPQITLERGRSMEVEAAGAVEASETSAETVFMAAAEAEVVAARAVHRYSAATAEPVETPEAQERNPEVEAEAGVLPPLTAETARTVRLS